MFIKIKYIKTNIQACSPSIHGIITLFHPRERPPTLLWYRRLTLIQIRMLSELRPLSKLKVRELNRLMSCERPDVFVPSVFKPVIWWWWAIKQTTDSHVWLWALYHSFSLCAVLRNEVKNGHNGSSGRSESSSCLEGIEPHVEHFQANAWLQKPYSSHSVALYSTLHKLSTKVLHAYMRILPNIQNNSQQNF